MQSELLAPWVSLGLPRIVCKGFMGREQEAGGGVRLRGCYWGSGGEGLGSKNLRLQEETFGQVYG